MSRYFHRKIHTVFKAIKKQQAIEVINQMNELREQETNNLFPY
jgi:hypothetical protein